MISNPEPAESLPPEPAPEASWASLVYLLAMLVLSGGNLLLSPKEWQQFIGIELLRSFTGIFVSGLGVSAIKHLATEKIVKIGLVIFGIMFLILISDLIGIATDGSTPLARTACFLNFYAGMFFMLKRAFQQAKLTEAVEKRGEISFDFPVRPFTRTFIALPGFAIPAVYFGLAFIQDFMLLRIRSRSTKHGKR